MTQTALDIATASEPELRRLLAKQPCPECNGEKGWTNAADGEWDDCPSCSYAGLAFPWAREPLCPHCGGACRPPPEGDNSPCEDCDDTGVLKAFGLDQLMEHHGGTVVGALQREHRRALREHSRSGVWNPQYLLVALQAVVKKETRH